jgi:transcriptional antiterminator NusG
MAELIMSEKPNWYVVHTYSGHENKVKANIEKIVENRGMEDIILEVAVPTEEVIEVKNGKKKSKLKKIFPGYTIVKMYMTDESWYVVRNTRGVTGFVGPGSKPVPLTDEEVKNMGLESTVITEIDIEVGDQINVISGPCESFTGVVEEINMEKQSMKVRISMFGRETPVELEFVQVEKL